MKFLLSFILVTLGLMGCSDERVAGTTSETDNTIAGQIEGLNRGGKITFTKKLESGDLDPKSIEASVSSNGSFEVEIEPKSWWFVAFEGLEYGSWKDSVWSSESGEIKELTMPSPSYLWTLKGSIQVDQLPKKKEGTYYRLGFKGTPFETEINNQGGFQFNQVLMSEFELELRWIDLDGNSNKKLVKNWNSPWYGIHEIEWIEDVGDYFLMGGCQSQSLMIFAQNQGVSYQHLWDICQDQIQSSQLLSSTNEEIDANSVAVSDSLILSNHQLYQVESTQEIQLVINQDPWDLANTSSIAQGSGAYYGMYYLPSGNTLAVASDLQTLNSRQWIQEINLESDSTSSLQVWEDELLIWNQKGDVKVRDANDLSVLMHQINVGPLIDLVRVTPDQIIVLRENNIVESLLLSSGVKLATKNLSEWGELKELGGLF